MNFDRTQSSIPYSLTVVIQELGSFTMNTIIGPIFPVSISPVSLTTSEFVVAIDTSEQALTGSLNVSLNLEPQGQVIPIHLILWLTFKTDVNINAYSGINIISLPLSNYVVSAGVPISTTVFLRDSKTTVGISFQLDNTKI